MCSMGKSGFRVQGGGGGALTRKRHIPPHPAQPRHTNRWAPRTRKRHQQEHRPQRPTKSSDPTQHAKGRTGDCPGPLNEGAMSHGGGGVRAPKKLGGFGKIAQLTDTIITNEKKLRSFWQWLCTSDFVGCFGGPVN